MKKFFKKTEGFTLVELIVVIAILGILAGVGTVGYSGYIKKANMAADQQLLSDVEQALSLNYYRKGGQGSGYVVLGANNDADEFGNEAMIAMFGEDWKNTIQLKCDDWGSNASDVKEYYTGSSFDGNEVDLMGTIDNLSGALANFLGDNPNSIGGTFGKFLADYGIDQTDSTKTANAAVLYVADVVNNKSSETKKVIADSLAGIGADFAIYGPEVAISNASGKIRAALGSENPGGAMVATCAVLYAYAEAYCQYSGEYDMDIDFSSVTTSEEALAAIQGGFTDLMYQEAMNNPGRANTYFGMDGSSNPAASKDAMAVMSALGAVDNVAGSVVGNLGSDTCYSDQSTQDLVTTYFETVGNMAIGDILVWIHPNGQTDIDAK